MLIGMMVSRDFESWVVYWVEIVLLCCNLDVIKKGYLILETRSTVWDDDDEVEIILLCCNLDVIEKGYLILETRRSTVWDDESEA